MVGLVLVGKLHRGGCVVQRSEQILFHVTDRAAVLCKALQHKADMVGVQLHKPAAYYLGGLIIPGNVQQLAVGGTGIHQQIHDLVDGKDIISGKLGIFDGVIETNTGTTVGESGKTLKDSDITGNINWYFKTVTLVQ